MSVLMSHINSTIVLIHNLICKIFKPIYGLFYHFIRKQKIAQVYDSFILQWTITTRSINHMSGHICFSKCTLSFKQESTKLRSSPSCKVNSQDRSISSNCYHSRYYYILNIPLDLFHSLESILNHLEYPFADSCPTKFLPLALWYLPQMSKCPVHQHQPSQLFSPVRNWSDIVSLVVLENGFKPTFSSKNELKIHWYGGAWVAKVG